MDALFEEPWTLAFREVVGPHDYVKISTERLQGLVTTVYVKRKHVHHIRDIHTSVTRTGFGGLWVSNWHVYSFAVNNDYQLEEPCENSETLIS